MSWPAVLLLVFATHLPIFAWRWWRTGERRHAATTLTFALLVVAYALRILAPELRIADVVVHEAMRVVAWCAAAVSLGMLLRHALAARSARRASSR